MSTSHTEFLASSLKLFLYYKGLGEKAIAQLDENALYHRENEDCNSIAMIVKHMHGNMMSRWTDFLNADGEKEWRDRDGEFEDTVRTRAEMMALWEEGWNCLFQAMKSIDSTDATTLVYIRNQGHTILEAVQRQLAHYAYHVGQIVYVGKMCASTKWRSLSIPKNKSSEFNRDKFSKVRKKTHFTDKK